MIYTPAGSISPYSEVGAEALAVHGIDFPRIDVLYNLHAVVVGPGHTAIALQLERVVDFRQTERIDFVVDPLVSVTLASIEFDIEIGEQFGGEHEVGQSLEMVIVNLEQVVVDRYLDTELGTVPLVNLYESSQVLLQLDAVGKHDDLCAAASGNSVLDEQVELWENQRLAAFQLQLEDFGTRVVDNLLESVECHIETVIGTRIHTAERTVGVATVSYVDIESSCSLIHIDIQKTRRLDCLHVKYSKLGCHMQLVVSDGFRVLGGGGSPVFLFHLLNIFRKLGSARLAHQLAVLADGIEAVGGVALVLFEEQEVDRFELFLEIVIVVETAFNHVAQSGQYASAELVGVEDFVTLVLLRTEQGGQGELGSGEAALPGKEPADVLIREVDLDNFVGLEVEDGTHLYVSEVEALDKLVERLLVSAILVGSVVVFDGTCIG